MAMYCIEELYNGSRKTLSLSVRAYQLYNQAGNYYQSSGCKNPFSLPKSFIYGSTAVFHLSPQMPYGEPMAQSSGKVSSETISPFFTRWE